VQQTVRAAGWHAQRTGIDVPVRRCRHHHVGCTVDREGNGQVYIDGKANGSAVSTSGITMATTGAMSIGARGYTLAGTYFDGLIDDVKIFNYALTAQQIKTIMNQGAVSFVPITGSP